MMIIAPVVTSGTARLGRHRRAVDTHLPTCDVPARTFDGTELRCTAIRGHQGAHIADLDGEPMWWGLP